MKLSIDMFWLLLTHFDMYLQFFSTCFYWILHVTNYSSSSVCVLNQFNADHGGVHGFRICNADGIENPDESCFAGNILKDANGRGEFPQPKLTSQPWKLKQELFSVDKNMTEVIKNSLMFIYKIVLPKDLKCEHCIFQVRV